MDDKTATIPSNSLETVVSEEKRPPKQPSPKPATTPKPSKEAPATKRFTEAPIREAKPPKPAR